VTRCGRSRYTCGLQLTLRIISQLDNLPGTQQRPRTRAWVKQEDESKRRRTAGKPINTARRVSSRQRGLQPGGFNNGLPEIQQDHTQLSRIASRTQQHRRPSIKQASPAKRLGKQFAKKPGKQEAKRKRVSGKRQANQDKRNTQRTAKVGQLEVSAPL